jgi:hypothetical protein
VVDGGWTPNQREVIERLLGLDGDLKPVSNTRRYDPDLHLRLRQVVEAAIGDVALRYTAAKPLLIRKHDLTAVFKCEGFLVAPDEGFAWTVQNARGKVVHLAISATLTSRGASATPLDLVEQAIDSLAASEEMAEFIEGLTIVQHAELVTSCADMLAKFQADWPPLRREWIPRIESGATVLLCDDRIKLAGKYDLALGHPGLNPSDVVIVDFKTGREYPEHAEEVRGYALLETLRSKVPPRKVASQYLDGGYFRDEEITEDGLRSAARRLTDGIVRIAELWAGERPAELTPGSTCRYCSALPECQVGAAWVESQRAGDERNG